MISNYSIALWRSSGSLAPGTMYIFSLQWWPFHSMSTCIILSTGMLRKGIADCSQSTRFLVLMSRNLSEIFCLYFFSYYRNVCSLNICMDLKFDRYFIDFDCRLSWWSGFMCCVYIHLICKHCMCCWVCRFFYDTYSRHDSSLLISFTFSFCICQWLIFL